jgi:hypothetical protein
MSGNDSRGELLKNETIWMPSRLIPEDIKEMQESTPIQIMELLLHNNKIVFVARDTSLLEDILGPVNLTKLYVVLEKK